MAGRLLKPINDQVGNRFVEETKQYQKFEEKRFRNMLDLILRFRDYEEEKLKLQLMQGGGSNNLITNEGGVLQEASEPQSLNSIHSQISNIQSNMR